MKLKQYIHGIASAKSTKYSAKATNLAYAHPNDKDYKKWSKYEMLHYYWLWIYHLTSK